MTRARGGTDGTTRRTTHARGRRSAARDADADRARRPPGHTLTAEPARGGGPPHPLLGSRGDALAAGTCPARAAFAPAGGCRGRGGRRGRRGGPGGFSP